MYLEHDRRMWWMHRLIAREIAHRAKAGWMILLATETPATKGEQECLYTLCLWMSRSEKQFVLMLDDAGCLYVDRVHQ